MDARELKRRAEAARECSIEAGGITFTVRLPQPVRMRALVLGATVGQGSEARTDWQAVLQRAALESVIGWKGVLQSHLVPDLPAEEGALGVPFDASLVPELLEAHEGMLDALAGQLIDKYSERQRAMELATKN